jgi:hypothetical protein
VCRAPPSTPYAGAASAGGAGGSPGTAAASTPTAVKRVPSPAFTRDDIEAGVNAAVSANGAINASPAIQLASPARKEATPNHLQQQQQTPIKQQQQAEKSEGTSSPRGAKDIFSMNTDKQLSDIYKFVKEVRLDFLVHVLRYSTDVVPFMLIDRVWQLGKSLF